MGKSVRAEATVDMATSEHLPRRASYFFVHTSLCYTICFYGSPLVLYLITATRWGKASLTVPVLVQGLTT